MSCELFIGNLNPGVRTRDLENAFGRYGRIVRCDLKKNYGFIQYGERRDAEQALLKENNRKLLGSVMTVEWAKGSVGDRRGGGVGGGGGRGQRHRSPPRGDRDRSPYGNKGGRSPPRGSGGGFFDREERYGGGGGSGFGGRRSSGGGRDYDNPRMERGGRLRGENSYNGNDSFGQRRGPGGDRRGPPRDRPRAGGDRFNRRDSFGGGERRNFGGGPRRF